MLERLRAAQSTWLGKAVLAVIFVLIIVGLSFFGIADLFRTHTANWAIKVGGTEVSADAYRQNYQNELAQLQQRLRRPITTAQARQLGLDQQVLTRLVTDALLDRQADQLGLAVSDAQIGAVVAQDPSFAGADGRFDRTKFNAFLQNVRTSEQAFAQDQRSTYRRQELIDALAGSVAAPKAAVDALHRLQAETRSVDMIVLEPSAVGDLPAPDDATLQSYFEAHKAQFAAPEYRKLTYLAVTPASVAKPDQVTAEDIAKAYDSAPKSRFGAPERRTVQQITFPTQEEAEAAALRIAAGTAFADIAAERKVSDNDLNLGSVSKAQMFDKAVADAAFALPPNGTSQPVKGTFGTVLVHVTDIVPGNRKPLDEVAPMLRKEIAEEPARTRDALRDIRDKIEDERASGKPLAEAAKAVGVEVRTVEAINSTGKDKSGTLVDLPSRDQVLQAAFASDVGVDNDVIQTRTGDQIWFEIQNIEPAHQRSFADVKPEVDAAWRKQETSKRLAAKADELVKLLAGGTTMEQIAAQAGGAEIKHVADVRRTGTAAVAPAVVSKIFDTAIGAAGAAEGDGNTQVVFRVLNSIVPPLDPDAPEAKQMDQQYRNWLSNDLMTAYLTRVQESVGVKVNPEVLHSAEGEGS